MKALSVFLIFFSALVSVSHAQQDEDALTKLIAGTEEFFDASMATTSGVIFFNTDEDGNVVKMELNFGQIKQMIKDLKKTQEVWTIDKAEKCSSLSLSTASSGACYVRNLQLGLAYFHVNFQKTKRVLRAKGDEGIEAARKLSVAVKSATLYSSVMCELHSAQSWGGSGSGMMTYGCLMDSTDKAIKMLGEIRLMATESDNQEVLNAQAIGKSTILDVQVLQNGLASSQSMVQYYEEEIYKNIQTYFEDFSEAAIPSTRGLLQKSTEVFVSVSIDYCSMYVAVVLPTFKDQSKYGDRVRMSCLKKITDERSLELNKVYTSLAPAE